MTIRFFLKMIEIQCVMNRFILPFLFLLGISFQSSAGSSSQEIRIGVVAFGTLKWELTTLKQERLDQQFNLNLKHRPLSNSQAGKIALHSGAVDIIVSDWIWVSRQRAAGSDFVFAPYSNAAGALIVPGQSKIQTVQDLKGRRIGIAGGGLDKNWLLLRALAEQQSQLDLDQSIEKVFAAPPLLNDQIQRGNLDAIINYWHYAVRLEAQGYKRILDSHSILQKLGITEQVPSLGYVFSESWANSNKATLSRFLSATRAAKDLICTNDRVWQDIVPLVRADQKQTLSLLRLRYCEGRIQHWGENERNAANKIFDLLYKFGGEKLTGGSSELEKGTFWVD